jgi:hypothetical protein
MLLMFLRGQSVGPIFLALALVAGGTLAGGGESKRKPDPGPPPNVRIEVEPLGYVAPSMAYLAYRHATTTLDFIDNGHLLFTFRDAGLMHRVPDDPAEDEDQVIRAEVIDIATGKSTEHSQWRMHDRQRYLWPLRGGRFLVRQRNSLYLTDSHLELRPYLQFERQLQLVEISPDRNLMVVEVQKLIAPDPDAENGVSSALSLSPPPKRRGTDVILLHPGDNSVLAESEARHPVDLALVEDSFLNLLESKDPGRWVIQREIFHGDPKIIGEFKSSCMPTIMTVSDSVALAIGCPPKGGSDHIVNAISLRGDLLWQDRWKERYIWPTFDYAEDGSRFAYGSLEVNRDIGFMDSLDQSDVVAQMIGVFDTQSGKLELVKNATPVLSAGHNYALSSDGRRFAILREGAIEVYDLPPVPAAPAAPPTASSSLAPGK